MKLADLLAAGLGGLPKEWEKMAADWGSVVVTTLSNLANVWTVYQLAMVGGAWLASGWISQRLTPRFEASLRTIEKQPTLLRLLATLLRRLHWIIFVALLVLITVVLTNSTWPSNSYIVRLAANLAAAWVVVSTISRLVRNQMLSNIFFALGWTAAALNITGFLIPTLKALDSIAFSIGGTNFSILLVIKGVVALFAMVWSAAVLGDFIERRMSEGLELSPAMQVLTGKLMRWALITIAIVASLSAVGVDLTAFTVLSGAIGIGIGFGLQKLASNLISGIIILSDRSIKPGDTITLGDTRGTINTLNSRYVSVLTLNGAELLVPNERFVTETVVNWSFSNRRMLIEVPFGVDYRSDPNHVHDVAIGVAKSLDRVLVAPEPRCQLRAFGDSSLDMMLLFWIDDPERGVANIRSEALFGLWRAFKDAGIVIPYPHREVFLHHPTPAAEQGKPPAAGDVPFVSASG